MPRLPSTRQASKKRDTAAKNQLRRFLFESLEVRNLLAVDIDWSNAISLSDLTSPTQKLTPSATYSYNYAGVSQPMVVLSDRIALDLTQAAAQDNSQLDAFGLQLSRPLNSQFSVYVSAQPVTEQLLASLETTGLIAKSVPVLGMLTSKSEAVLLNEVIVAVPANSSVDQFFSDVRYAGYRKLPGTTDQFVATLKDAYGLDALAEISDIEADGKAQWVSPNFHQAWQKFYTPNDPRFGNEWHLNNVGQSGSVPDIDSNLPEAWDVNRGGSSSIVVGVVDDGVPTNHPDLLNWTNIGEIAGDGIDNDGNGWVDDTNGWNFVNNDAVSFPDTATDAHGTAVAGVAAARGDNGIGVAGPSYQSPVLSARIFQGNAVADDAGIAAAIYYASGRTIDGQSTFPAASVVNHSWGGGGASFVIQSALHWATTVPRSGLGVPQFIASGNSFGEVSFPSNLSAVEPGVISVGAINNLGTKSDYSNYGPELDFVTGSNDTRPGFLGIDTTDRVGTPGYSATDYTSTFGGTSSATPVATGIAALALAQAEQLGVNISASDMKKLMRNNTKLVGPDEYSLPEARNNYLGSGLLDAATLLRGVGTSKISVTTEKTVVLLDATHDMGNTIVDGTYTQTFRIRNQGTAPLELGVLSVLGDDFSIFQQPSATVLDIGEATTFAIRLMPTSAGAKTATVKLASNDPSLPAMRFFIISVANDPSISGYVYEDFNGDQTRGLDEAGVPNQRVFADINQNNVEDYTTYTRAVPLTIPDSTQVQSPLLVNNFVGLATDIDVTVTLTHGSVDQLLIELVGPSGKRATLVNHLRGGANLTNTRFDDQAIPPVNAGNAPYSTSYRPETPLSVFNNVSPNGAWRLYITDRVTGTTGVLNNWSMRISREVAFTDETGFYRFSGLPQGSYSVYSTTPSGFVASGVTQYLANIASPASSVISQDFGIAKNSTTYVQAFADYDQSGLKTVDEPGLASSTFLLSTSGDVSTSWTSNSIAGIRDFTTIIRPIEIPAGFGNVSDVNVRVNLSHTDDSDLVLTLIAPDFTSVVLSNRRGGSGDDFVETYFDDAASISVTAGAAPFFGSYRPEQPLNALNGRPASGTWFLQITDVASGDVGTLLNWSLDITATLTSAAALVTDENGWGKFAAPSITTQYDLVNDPNWVFTQPSTGSRTISQSSATPIYDMTFGTRPNNALPTMDDLPDLMVAEDFGTIAVNLSGLTAGLGDSEDIRVTATLSSTAVLASPIVSYVSPDSTGILFLDTVLDQSGDTLVQVLVEDAGPDNDFSTTNDNLSTFTYFTVTVTPVNDAPLVNVNDIAIDEDSPTQTITLTGIAAGGGESQSLSLSVTSSNTAMIPNPLVTYTSPNSTALLTFTPIANTFGFTVFTVTLMDAGLDNVFGTGDEQTTISTFTVTVRPLNDAPTLNPLANISLVEDGAQFVVNLSGITAGPLESQQLLVTASASNSVVLTPTVSYISPNSTGQIVIRPAADQSGTSTITVTVDDGNAQFSRVFVVTVSPVNDVPLINPLGTLVIDEDSPTQTVALTGILSGGGENQALRVTAVSGSTSLIPSPVISYTSPNTTGTLTFTGSPNAYGSTTIVVTVADAGLDAIPGNADDLNTISTLTVTIRPVNDLPTLDPIANIIVDEDSPPFTVGLTGISSGPLDFEQARVSAVSSNTALVQVVATSSVFSSTGSLNFVLQPDQFGTAIITVTVEDAGLDSNFGNADDLSFARTLTVTVNNVSDPPFFDPVADIQFSEDTQNHVVNITGIITGGGELQQLRLIAKTSRPGELATTNVNYTSPNSTGSIIINSLPNEYGVLFVTAVLEDGGLDYDLNTPEDNEYFRRTFTLTILPVNDPPVVNVPTLLNILEDAPTQTVDLTNISSGPFESDPVDITVSSSDTTLIPTPTLIYTSPSTAGQLTYRPVADRSGTAFIVLRLEDGGADARLSTAGDNTVTLTTITVNVQPVNDPPTINTISNVTIDEDSTGQLVTISGIGAGVGESQSLRVTATSDNASLIVNPTVSYTSPNSTGQVQVTSFADQSGVAIVSVTVEDGGNDGDLNTAGDNLKTVQTFTVTVRAVNDLPTLDPIANVTVNEDSNSITTNLSGISAGPNESQPLRITASSSNTSLIPNPTSVYVSPSALGAIQWSTLPNQFGSSVITVAVEDGGLDQNLATASDNLVFTRSFTVTVNSVNDQPTLGAITNRTILEDALAQTVNLTGITAGGGESQSLRVSASSSNVQLIPNLSINYSSPNNTAALVFAPAADASGQAVITVTVEDGGLDNDFATIADNALATQTFTISVSPVNDVPSINSVSNISTPEETEVVVDLQGILAGGGESQPLRVSAISSNTVLVSSLTTNYISPEAIGTLGIVPNDNAIGQTVITITVEDGGLDNNLITLSDNAMSLISFTLVVTEVNDPPTIGTIADQVIDEDSSQSLLVSDITAGLGGETQSIQVRVSSDNPGLLNPTISNVSTQNNASIDLTPTADSFGSAVISVTVEDGGIDGNLNTANDNLTFTRSFTVTVRPVNDDPSISPISNVTIDEGGQSLINLSGIAAGNGESQALRVTATSSNLNLVPTLNVAYTSPNAFGSLTIQSIDNQIGNAVITVSVEDGGDDNNLATLSDNLIKSTSFTVTVNAVNDAPTINSVADVSFAEDGNVVVNLSGISAGPNESQPIRILATSSNTSLVAAPTVSFVTPSSTGTLLLQSLPNAFGQVTVTYQVEDGGLDNDLNTTSDNGLYQSSFVVTVQPVNDTPAIATISSQLIESNSANNVINLTGISSGPGENDNLRIRAVSSNGAVVPNPTVDYVSPSSSGTLNITPVSGAFGAVTIQVTVEDGGADGDISTVSDNLLSTTSFVLTVNAIPVANPERVRTTRNVATNISVLSNDTDADGSSNALTPVVTAQPPVSNGTVNVLGDGSIRFVPATNYFGVTSFKYAAQDANGSLSPETEVTIGVGRSALQNPFNPVDTNRNGLITASDALVIIDVLNNPNLSKLVDDLLTQPFDLDVNGDGRITPSDALIVIDALNASSNQEGEGVETPEQVNVHPHDAYFDNFEVEQFLKRVRR